VGGKVAAGGTAIGVVDLGPLQEKSAAWSPLDHASGTDSARRRHRGLKAPLADQW